ncbi:MAG: SufS family cysteine desulfurase [Gemmatimonadetes bacterium]|nr:SufS family cysteine desulfurase [Gemmatimonadota bacterium]
MTTTQLPGLLPELEVIRADFPILERTLAGGLPLVYLDSANTSQKPQAVIRAVDGFYREHNANVSRAVHALGSEATEAYEGARGLVAGLLGAKDPREVVFVRGATEAINLVAQSYARPRLSPGDEILVTWMEHHSNLVPWQLVAEQTGARVRGIPMDDRGVLDLHAYEKMLGRRTRVVAVGHVSNALGTVNPVARIAELAHAAGAAVVVDGAQSAAHVPVSVQELGADFYAISGHKAFAPMGTGALWGRLALLEEMPPWMGGGDMIRSVSFEGSTWADVPAKFEAGTPNAGGVVALGAAIDWMSAIGLDRIREHEEDLLRYGTAALADVPGLRLIGTAPDKVAILSFVLEGVHPHDVGTILDREGIAVRTGHHCAQPVMEHFGVPATTRASLSVYNTREDLDALVAGLQHVRQLFG